MKLAPLARHKRRLLQAALVEGSADTPTLRCSRPALVLYSTVEPMMLATLPNPRTLRVGSMCAGELPLAVRRAISRWPVPRCPPLLAALRTPHPGNIAPNEGDQT